VFFSHIKHSFVLLWVGVFFCSIAASAQSSPSLQQELQPFIQKIVAVSQELQKQKDLKVLQPLTESPFSTWYKPGICFVHQKDFLKSQIKGWIPAESHSTQDPVLLLTMEFKDLKNTPLMILKEKSFDPYSPDACGSAPFAKKKEWYEKWIVYPGDYLAEENRTCEGKITKSRPILPKNATSITLLYFKQDGENLYLGINKTSSGWILSSVAMDEDCVD